MGKAETSTTDPKKEEKKAKKRAKKDAKKEEKRLKKEKKRLEKEARKAASQEDDTQPASASSTPSNGRQQTHKRVAPRRTIPESKEEELQNSVYFQKRIEVAVSVLPAAMGNIQAALEDAVRLMLLKYTENVGILLTFENLEVIGNGGHGMVLDEIPYLHYKVGFDGLVFCPKVGSKVRKGTARFRIQAVIMPMYHLTHLFLSLAAIAFGKGHRVVSISSWTACVELCECHDPGGTSSRCRLCVR